MIPKPTKLAPFLQIEWIFEQIASEKSPARQKSFIFARNKYIQYMKQSGDFDDFLSKDKLLTLNDIWSYDSLIKFNAWLREVKLSSLTKYSLYKNIRNTMDYAYALSFIDSLIYHEPFYRGIPETNEAKAYTDKDEALVSELLDNNVICCMKMLTDYVPKYDNNMDLLTDHRLVTSEGTFVNPTSFCRHYSIRACRLTDIVMLVSTYNFSLEAFSVRLDYILNDINRSGIEFVNGTSKIKPIVYNGQKISVLNDLLSKMDISRLMFSALCRTGFSLEEIGRYKEFQILPPPKMKVGSHEHMRYIFDTICHQNSEELLAYYYDNFYRNENARMSGVLDFIGEYGVAKYPTEHEIVPLLLKLAQITGLNYESVKSLEIDCFRESHPLTGQPYIKYNKERSSSNSRSSSKELYINNLVIQDFEEEFFDDDTLSNEVRVLINLILELTKDLRNQAPEEIKGLLFIFKKCVFGLSKENRHEDNMIRSIEGCRHVVDYFCTRYKKFLNEGSFNTKKFRPTLVTNLIRGGADLFQVCLSLGHKSPRTTEQYIDTQKIATDFDFTIVKALKEIIAKTKEELKPKKVDPKGNDTIPIKTLSGCGCKNPFNPSENVRVKTNFKDGQFCRHWNMCLLCDKVLITVNSLPKLFAYERELQELIASKSTLAESKKELINSIIYLLEGILEPDEIFLKEDLLEANELSFKLSFPELDQLVYQGI